MLLWFAALALILYSAITSCLRRTPSNTTPRAPRRPWWGSGPGSGWFSGFRPDTPGPGPNDPPPPYTKYPSSTPSAGPAQAGGWRPGFWTGAALGGLGAYMFNRQQRPRDEGWTRPRVVPVPSTGCMTGKQSACSALFARLLLRRRGSELPRLTRGGGEVGIAMIEGRGRPIWEV